MKRLISLLLLCGLLFTLPAGAANTQPDNWSRVEPGGNYVTIRVPYPQGTDMLWSEHRYLSVRYADTKEPVALSSEYQQGCLFATVPAAQANRPLEAFMGEPAHFNDCYVSWTFDGTTYMAYDVPLGAPELNVRGIILGDGAGNLMPGQVITRAEAFTILCRLLGLEPEGDPGFADVAPTDWFYDAASAAKAAGITNEPQYFRPTDPVTRGEFTVMLHRAMKTIGWMEEGAGAAADLSFADAGDIPAWALESYLAFLASTHYSAGIFTRRDTDQFDEFGPIQELLAQWDKGATREEVIDFVYDALRWLPLYPRQAAIEWGFDQEMPVIDGSTSTLPYTRAVYAALFANYDNHPQYPQSHSKSYYSYERLINGEADILFISTKPTEDTLAKAKAAGVELELTPIAYDAMVFFTNGENPIDNLTMEQIRNIYVDNAYTNWSQLGGPDAGFIPYCRNADSGSQAQMEEFFLHGDEIHSDIRRETTSVSMASVLTDVWQAKTEEPLAYALGYSIYYYYQSTSRILLSSDDDLKLLAIEGVYPTDQTIADGSYPLAGYNYAVVRADEPAGSPARRMVEFMLSEAGQNCVINAGFGALRPTPEEYLAKLKAGDVASIDWPIGREEQPATQEVVSLLNAAAASIVDEAPEEAAVPLLWYLELNLPPNRWSIIDTRICLQAGLAENLVQITGSDALPIGTVWVEDEALYELVRTCMDTPDGPIDQAAYAQYKDAVDAYVADLSHIPSGSSYSVQQELNAFYLLAENKALNTQVYVMGILRTTTPTEIAYAFLAGGEYVDSKLRIHGDTTRCLIIMDGEPVGVWNLDGSDQSNTDNLAEYLASFKTKDELLNSLEP